MLFDDREQDRLRTVFTAVVSAAPMPPELETLADSAQPLPVTNQRPRRMLGVAVMAVATVAVLIAVGVAGLLRWGETDSADSTMHPGLGASPAVESMLLDRSDAFDEFIPGTGRHVATYVGPGGPVEVYSYEATIRIPEFTDDDTVLPGTALHGYCIAWGPSGAPSASDCATVPHFPVEAPVEQGFDVAEATGEGTGLVLVPPDVVEVILEFTDGTQISIRPAAGVAYAVWESGGFPRQTTIVRNDGTSERVSRN